MVLPFNLKKKQIIAIAAFAVLAILNPSVRQFKDFIGSNRAYDPNHKLVRSANLIILSFYKNQLMDSNGEDIDSEKMYLGVLNNFIKL
jgi:hypothetical protein